MNTRKLATSVVMLCLWSCHPKKKSDSALENAAPSIDLATQGLPAHLEDTGLFIDRDIQKPGAGVQKYEVRVPLWSDGAQKDRFVFVPEGKAIRFDGTKLNFPAGSVFVKHFRSDNDPGINIETRVIVLNADGTWTFGSYAWNEDGTTELLDRSRTVSKGGKDYRIPSPKECVSCHRPKTEVLGFAPAQLNGLPLPAALDAQNMLSIPALGDVRDKGIPIETRARTYMHVNCSMCHNPDGPPGANAMDFRLESSDTGLIELGKVFPGNAEASILFQKISADTSRMPPVSIRPDPLALEIFRAWIESMPQEEVDVDADVPSDPTVTDDSMDELPDPEDDARQS